MKKLILICFTYISLAFLFTGCFDAFNPFCPTEDASKITASIGITGTGGMVINGTAGAVEPGATVMIVDEYENKVTTIADENGGFTLIEADLPEGFDHTLGHVLEVTQESEGCREGTEAEIIIIP
ncbi:MAG: hypothetical protein U9N03_05455 [Candidatus Caldatribacteriota bacterium]|nr:hypothetical protein [Candidatus Caldatribacteriota bacterium]